MEHGSQNNIDSLSLLMEIRAEIAKEVGKGRLNLAEMLALLKMLEIAENEFELRRLASFLAPRFPVLEYFVHQEREQHKVEIEDKVQEIVARLILEDPLVAAEISKDIMKASVPLEVLAQKYPIIQKYL